MLPRRGRGYDIHAVLMVHAEKLRARREAAVAELAAERKAAARLEAERQRARDAEWSAQSRAERTREMEDTTLLTWLKRESA